MLKAYQQHMEENLEFLSEQLDREINEFSGEQPEESDFAREEMCVLAEQLDQTLAQVRKIQVCNSYM